MQTQTPDTRSTAESDCLTEIRHYYRDNHYRNFDSIRSILVNYVASWFNVRTAHATTASELLAPFGRDDFGSDLATETRKHTSQPFSQGELVTQLAGIDAICCQAVFNYYRSRNTGSGRGRPFQRTSPPCRSQTASSRPIHPVQLGTSSYRPSFGQQRRE